MPTTKLLGGNTVTDADPLQTQVMQPLPAGSNTIGSVTLAADPFGVNADAAITSDTTGSISGKLRGLVKWAYERMPASLGQKTMTNSLPVVLPSDQTITTTGGTQYTEGDVDATITGTALLWEDAGNTLATANAANPMPVRQVALSSVDLPLVAGTVAHDGVDSGNPIKVGGKAHTSDITAVSDGDRVDALFTKLGKQVVLPYSIPENMIQGVLTSNITDTTSTQVIAAQAAGIRIYITSLSIQNSHATVATWVKVTDGNAGTVLWRVYCPAAGGGETITFLSPLKGSAATRVDAVCETTGASVGVALSGYIGA